MRWRPFRSERFRRWHRERVPEERIEVELGGRAWMPVGEVCLELYQRSTSSAGDAVAELVMSPEEAIALAEELTKKAHQVRNDAAAFAARKIRGES
jgi:hypothetical protein